jgi:hypothetical protein
MLSLPHTEFDMGNMAGVLQEAEIAYSSGAPESTPGFFGGVHAAHMFLVLSVVCIVLVLSSLFSGVRQLFSITIGK